ncbi:MAG: leucine-rich repeat protein [Muribaculaceae bacterium]|nr:leucine-rich repeat protein [Muribaculaceae bacterium]
MKHLIKLAFLLLALLLPATATAHDFMVNGIYYKILNNNEVEVTYKGTSYNSYSNEYSGSVAIPPSVTYNGKTYSVTTIGGAAFDNCSGLTSVTIPNTVTTIGGAAFIECSSLTSVTIPNTVTTIGGSAFQGCNSLTSIDIPNLVTAIDGYTFFNCSSLTNVTIPDSVTTIGEYAFYGCSSMTSITIPNAVTTIGEEAFHGCSSLEILNFNAISCADFSSDMSSSSPFYNLNISTVNIGESVQIIPNCFAACLKKLSAVEIPNSVRTIGKLAFVECSSLTSIEIPNSVTSIGEIAFAACTSLASIDLPNSITSISELTFASCTSLTSIEIPNSVTTIGNDAFSGCSGLTSVTIPNSVASIGERVFSYCTSLASIDLPNSVTSIDNEAFYGCSGLTNVIIGNTIASIGVRVFSGCTSLASIDLPNSVTSIGEGAFSGCSSLTSIDIPNSLVTITGSVFSGCSALTSVTIPNSVTSIGVRAFSDCSSLTSIDIPNSVTTISAYAFYNCSDMASVTIPNSVTTIDGSAFSGCSSLTSIDLSNTLTTISESLFSGCSSLASVNIPNTVTSIGGSAFSGCSSLTSIDLPSSVSIIGERAFYGCYGLTILTIPNAVTTIGNAAFQDCSSLEILNFNAISCADFSSSTNAPFYNLNISTINIGDSVKRIPAYFAYGLSQLAHLTISKSVTFIGKQAFYNAPSIQSVTCAAETPPSWNNLSMFTTNVYNHSPLYVPIGCEQTYMSDQCWGQFATIVGKNMQNEVLATSISLDKSQMNMLIGSISQLTATVLPDSTTNKVVNWTSGNPAVATVDGNGMVTAVASGVATITAMTTDGSNLSASCVVTVVEDLSNYDNYLSIPDAEAFHGDTIVVPVKMFNEADVISFQTDIFLPEGLELLQEDGEFIIDPSERMTRTHSIMSNQLPDGSIRVLCYSSNYKPFTGNSGDDLFYLTVKVADDAEGDYTIQLKNTLLTNADFVDMPAPDVAATVNVKAYILGDANNSGLVTVGDVVTTAQYVLLLNPQPFNFEAADVNFDGNITVGDVSRIAWMVLNPGATAPRRAPAVLNSGDRMSGEGISLMPGETRRVSLALDNAMDYSAFQLDLSLPEGLTASNFHLTDRAGSHAFDVNTLGGGKFRALCYSPALTAISGHEGALLTFDVTANSAVTGAIMVDGIELVTTACESVRLDGFAIDVNSASGVNEQVAGKTVARVDYFNLAGQQIDRPEAGVTLVVTTYTDGTRTTAKVIK